MARIPGLQVPIEGDERDLKRALRQGEQDISRFSDTAEKELGGFSAQAQKDFQAFGNIATRTLQAASAALSGLAVLTVTTGKEISTLSRRASLATDTFQAIAFEAQRAGRDGEDLVGLFVRIREVALEAAQGNQTYITDLEALGLSYRELIDASPEEQYDLVADAIARADGNTRLLAASSRLFSGDVENLFEVLLATAGGLDQVIARQRELGQITTAPALQATEDVANLLVDAGRSFTASLRQGFGEAVSLVDDQEGSLVRIANAAEEIGTAVGNFTTNVVGFVDQILIVYERLQGITAGSGQIAAGQLAEFEQFVQQQAGVSAAALSQATDDISVSLYESLVRQFSRQELITPLRDRPSQAGAQTTGQQQQEVATAIADGLDFITLGETVGHGLSTTISAAGQASLDNANEIIQQLLVEQERDQNIAMAAQGYVTNISSTLGSAIASGNFSNVGQALVAALTAELASSLLEQGLNFLGGVFGIPGFQHGGFVDGPEGAPRLAVVHGGELILNREQQQNGLGDIIIQQTLVGDVRTELRRAFRADAVEYANTVRDVLSEQGVLRV